MEQQLIGSEAMQRLLQELHADQQRQDTDIGTVADGTLYPVDISTLTPTTTFRKNAVLGINGVLYRAKVATSAFPVALVTDDARGQFVIDMVNGKRAFVIDDPAVHQDWEVWTDAGIEYWIALQDARMSALAEQKQDVISDLTTIRSNAALAVSALQMTSTVGYGGQTYTVQELLKAVASLMGKTVVVND